MIETIKTRVFPLLKETVSEFQRDECLRMGASLAYYALFSLFPLLLVVLSVVGAVVGPGSGVRAEILNYTAQATGSEQVVNLIDDTLKSLNENSTGAGVIGFITLLMSASVVFGALDQSFNRIWDLEVQQAQQEGLVSRGLTMAYKKVLSFLLILGVAALLLVLMFAGTAITVVSNFVGDFPGGALLWQLVHFGVGLVILTLVMMVLFKFLPDTRVAWGDVWLGALMSAILFVIFQKLVGLYIGGRDFQSYGVVGGVMALLLWIYLTSQVLFLGGEFTQVYAHMYGSYRPQPEPAEPEPEPAQPVEAPAPQPARRQTLVAAGVGALAGMLGALVLAISAVVLGLLRLLRLFRRPA